MSLFNWSGRLNRAKYFGYSLLAGIVAAVVGFLLKSSTSAVAIVNLLLLVVSSMFVVKRFHDMEKPGWHFWLLLIPFYNIYLVIVLLFKKGTMGANPYGPDPLASPVPAPMPPAV